MKADSIRARIREWGRFAWWVMLLLTAGAVIGLTGCAAISPPPAPAPTPAPAPAPEPVPVPAPAPPVTYTLNVTTDPIEGGSISPSSGTYDSGESVTLTATAFSDYQFDHWSGDASGTSSTVKITMDSDKSVIAHYTKIVSEYTLSASISPVEGGSVSPSGGVYHSGESVVLMAMPSPGYQFDRWEGDASGSLSSTSVTMDSNKNVIAYFKKLYQTMEYTMPPGAASSYYVSYGKELKAGETVDGFVELTGEHYSGDELYSWSFQIFGPAKERVHDWEGNIVTKQHHDFSFTASRAGIYTIRVSHVSRYSKNLVIEIQPPGW